MIANIVLVLRSSYLQYWFAQWGYVCLLRWHLNLIGRCEKDAILICVLFSDSTEYVICRHCGSDITISNFFQDKLSPLALSITNQTFHHSKTVLIQTLENPLGIRFKVAIANRARCAIINSRVSFYGVATMLPPNASYLFNFCVLSFPVELGVHLVSRVQVACLFVSQVLATTRVDVRTGR